MTRTYRVFIVMSAAIFLSDAAFVALNYHFSRHAFDASLVEQSERSHEEFNLVMSLSYRNMLQLATYIGMQPEVRRLYLEGKRGVEAEGGGPGGPRAAKARDALHAVVRAPWKVMTDQFGLRQLHFQLGPGSFSFLRVHAPKKFGDRMDDLRYIIVDTNAERVPHVGFETGRVYCGVRGVIPVTGIDPTTGEEVYVGAMEVGTSFGPVLKTFDRYLTSGLAVLLTEEHVHESMWPEYVKKRFGDQLGSPTGLLVEATNRPEIERLLLKIDRPSLTAPTLPRMIPLDDAFYALSFFPFRDYRGERHPELPAVGVIAHWQDVTPLWHAFVNSQQVNVAYAIVGFLLVESLLYYGYRVGTRKLGEIIDEQVEEIRKEQTRAVDANAMKDTFVSLVAHDLRSPLTGIRGLADLVRKNGHTDPAFEEKALREISHSATHMETMITELLDLNRLQNGQMIPEIADIPLAPFTRETLAPLMPVAKSKKVTIDIALEESDTLRADPDLLQQALRNLVSNAIKFCDVGGRVRIGSLSQGRGFVVEDDGVGVAPERIPTLTRLDVKTSTPGVAGERGTGLGLPFVNLIVKAHGGTMTIESTLKQGTRVTVTL